MSSKLLVNGYLPLLNACKPNITLSFVHTINIIAFLFSLRMPQLYISAEIRNYRFCTRVHDTFQGYVSWEEIIYKYIAVIP